MRKTEKVTIADEGRDCGKTFVITEMPAWDSIQWAARAYLSIAQTGVQVPDGAFSGGPEMIAASGIALLSLVPASVALPLLEEARACIKFQPPAGDVVALQPVDFGGVSAIEEPKTWMTLLRRVFVLHVGFIEAGEPPITG